MSKYISKLSNAPQRGDPATALPWRIRDDRKNIKKSSKNRQKTSMNIDQKSTKNDAKNFPKMDEHQAKTAPRDALVGSWPPRGPNTPPRLSLIHI